MDHPAATPASPTPVQPSADWLDPPVPPPHTPPPTKPPPGHDLAVTASTARRFIQALVVFLCLFLVIRTVALEPFGVPTGSMAPALIGNHREAPCPRCDYPVRVGEPGPDARPIRFDHCQCPNCGEPIDLSEAREVPGDRLMVDKTAFQSRPPRRWEVAVFRCPADLSKPYVKRVVGLPGEWVQIADGDAYANGELIRKTLAQVREVRLPVFDLNYSPQPDGWGVRWLVEPIASRLPVGPRPAVVRTADGTILRDNTLYLEGGREPDGVGLTYRHWNIDSREEEPVSDWFAYNGGPSERRSGFARKHSAVDPVHDFLVSFDLEIVNGSGVFACRLADGGDTVRADIPVGTEWERPVQISQDGGRGQTTGGTVGLRPGRVYRIEFAFVDRRASLAIDGREVVPALDLPAEPPGRRRRGGVTRPLQLGVRGAAVAVRNLRLDRDIHYLPAVKVRGWQLGPTEYFLLGDNTSNSHDSRLWTIADRPAPGVPEADFLGKPFLIHQPLRLGRVTVNGRDRTVQTLDWSRLRWLR